MDKENKKFKNVTTSQTRHLNHQFQTGLPQSTPSNDFGLNEVTGFLNSTVKNPADFLCNPGHEAADLSSISSIAPQSNFNLDFNNDFATVMPTNNNKRQVNTLVTTPAITGVPYAGLDLFNVNKVISTTTSANNLVNEKHLQHQLDHLNVQELMAIYLKENLKKTFRDEEQNAIKDMLEIHKAHQNLSKECMDLEVEDSLIDQLIELVKFINSFNKWFDALVTSFESFKIFYKKLVDATAKAKNYLTISNIHIDENTDFEETLAAELDKTCFILNQISERIDDSNLVLPDETKFEEKLDYKQIEELKNQYNKLKDSILKFNSLKLKQF